MLIWILVIVSSVLLDQLTKQLVLHTMTLHEKIPFIKGLFSLHYIQNDGAGWGALSDHRWVFLVITGIAIVILPILLYRYRKVHLLFSLSLSLIIGGAIGNMIDRVFFYYVTDFIEFDIFDALAEAFPNVSLFRYAFPVFNVADICVTVGAALMFFYLAFLDRTFFPPKTKRKDDGTDVPQGNSDNG